MSARTGLRSSRATGALRNRVVDVVVLSSAVVLGMFAIMPAYGTQAALPAILGGAVLGAALVLVARAQRWAPLTILALAFVLYLGFGGPLAAPTTTTAGLPTLNTLLLLLSGVVTAWKEMLTLTPPLGAVDNLLVVPFLMALAGTVAATMVATGGSGIGRGEPFPELPGELPGVGLRGLGTRASQLRTVLAGAIPIGITVLAILLGTVDAPMMTVVGLGLVVLLIPWTSWRLRRWHPKRLLTLILMASVAVGSGVFVAPLVADDEPRLVLRNEIVPPFDPKDLASPLAGYRKFIKDFEDTDLVTVRGLPEGGLVRIATMDRFDGVVWNVATASAAQGSGAFRRVGEIIPTHARGDRSSIEIEIEGLEGIWLPTVGYATQIDFVGRNSVAQRAAFRFNDVTGAAVLPSGITPADTYRLEVVVPVRPDDGELGDAREAQVIQPPLEGVPDSVEIRASEIGGTAVRPALVASALEASLSSTGWFSHGIAASDDYPSLSGHGAERINELLTGPLMVGDSEQYASAMALMARSRGLPSRVVLGFIPEEDADGETITFTGADAQAWVEIGYEGFGWVPYFPTPDSTRTPSEQNAEQEKKPQPQVIQPPPPPADPVVPPREDVEDPEIDTPDDDLENQIDVGRILLLTGAIGVPILLILLPPLLILAAKARRRRRRQNADTALARVTGGWDEILDVAQDHRFESGPVATRRENAIALERAFPGAQVVPVARRADTAVFDDGDPTEEQAQKMWEGVEHTVGIIAAQGSGGHRLRGRITRTSLKTRRRASRPKGTQRRRNIRR